MGRPRKSEEEKGVVTWSRLPPAVRRKLKARCTAPFAGPATLSAVIRERIEAADTDEERIALALVAARDGGIDGAHHKMWVIDQMVRALTGPNYERWVRAYCDGEDGPDTYEWDTGIAP